MLSNIKVRLLKALCLIFAIINLLSCKTPSILVTQEQQKGDYYNNLNQYEQAIVHYENCLSASAKLGTFRNIDMEADICRKIAHGYSVLGKFDDAISYTNQALSRDSIQNNQLEIIEDYRMLGSISLYKGDFKTGIPYLERTLKLNSGMEASLKGLNQLSIADTYLSLAQVYTVLGRFDQSIDYTKSALDIYNRLNDKKGLMEGNLILGNTYLNLGILADAKKLINKSLDLAKELDLSQARQYQALGELFTATSDFEQALKFKMNALDEAEKSGIIPQIVWNRIGVGDAYASIGDNDKAINYYRSASQVQDTSKMTALALQASSDMRLGNVQQAQQYFMEINADVASGLASLRMGELNYESGKVEAAIGEYLKAIDFFSSANVNEGIAKADLRLGDININSANYDEATTFLKSASNYASEEETIWEIWYQKGRLFEFTNQTDSAINAYKKSIEIIEDIRGKFTIEEYKSRYIDDKVKVYDRLIRLLLESGDGASAFEFSERARARAFLDMIGNRKVAVKNTSDRELVNREQDLRLHIQSLSKIIQKNDLGTSRGLSRYQVEEELEHARKEYTDVIEKIKLTNRDYASMVSIEPVYPESVCRDIDTESALISYWTGEEYLGIWILTHDGIKFLMQKINSNTVSELVTDSRKSVLRTSDFQVPKDDRRGTKVVSVSEGTALSGRDLYIKDYLMLISPIENLIKGFKNLCIIPHGALHFLPFQALILPDGHYMIENYNIFYTPSASIFLLTKEKKNNAQKQIIAMALGDLKLGEFSGLPGTTAEVNQIKNLYNNTTDLYESRSSETYFKENGGLYKYIHLATHGILDPDLPLYSYLLLAPTDEDDGLLTVSEIFGLNLNARLVTLSACQTGLGDISQGDDIIGLSRAFIYAGSPSVIVSLWSVADQPTALLMTTFYKNLDNHSLEEALGIAQREVLKNYPAPFYWAPFQLIGGGN
jgi:tetratricopeptide (TPR) repeat protein